MHSWLMYPRLCKPLESRSFFLFGARGTGKTKLLETLFKENRVPWIDLLKRGEYLEFAEQPRMINGVEVLPWQTGLEKLFFEKSGF